RQIFFEEVVGSSLDVSRKRIVAPSVANKILRLLAFALRGERACEGELALCGDRARAAEESAYGCGLTSLLPEHGLCTAPEEPRARPIGVIVDEGGVAVITNHVVVTAEQHPFGDFARDGIAHAADDVVCVADFAFAHELDGLPDGVEFGKGRKLSECRT